MSIIVIVTWFFALLSLVVKTKTKNKNKSSSGKISLNSMKSKPSSSLRGNSQVLVTDYDFMVFIEDT